MSDGASTMRRGQAMVEALIALLVLIVVFFFLWRLELLVIDKIMLQHAAMRVARARAVGFNEAVCRRTARAAIIPSAGKRTWPEEGLSVSAERSRVSIYLGAADDSIASRVLDYERWNDLLVNSGDETSVTVSLKNDSSRLEGSAGIEPHAAFYMNGSGN